MTPIEVENVPPDPGERTASDPRPIGEGRAVNISPTVDLRPTPDPCPICGAPDGSCTTHTDPFAETVPGRPVGDGAIVPTALPGTTQGSRRVRVQGTEDANSDPDAKVYICVDDVVEVYEAGMPGRTARKSRRLVHRKGEIITRERAIQLGLVEGVPSAPPVPPPPRRSVEGTPVTVPQL